ncbi:Zinc finger, PMZ-type [Sesbania bispinosa]|nr:Zinc finger, PMZ-type [Sesbania bispinosa]
MDENLENCDGFDGGLEDIEQMNDEDVVIENALNRVSIDGEDDFLKIDPSMLNEDNAMRIHFPDVEVAYNFYNWYGRLKGFSARKGKVRKNKSREPVEKIFLCHREGEREKKNSEQKEAQVRESKPQTRTGCLARMKVRVDKETDRWNVTAFSDVHNHKMLAGKYSGMLPAHRRMTEADVMQMNNLRMVGISTPHIYGTFASQSGGYQHIGFNKRDIYNEIVKQRQVHTSDVKSAIQYLRALAKDDKAMLFRHTVDGEGRLQRLFWCDGHSQVDYKVFGDVLAFDATYKRNKYNFPLVIFSGVNHHNQTTVFASAVIADETEDSYVWLLEQLMVAMKGKAPQAVITDGDVAIRNAIRRVLPKSHHRLCAWHLLRNATSNVKNSKMVTRLKKCMLGDYEISEFQRRWDRMVTECGLQDNTWVKELYERKSMWATAWIKGSFFAGVRTTSRCEGLHAQPGKFVQSRNGFLDFLQNFNHCIESFRYKEVEADYGTVVGEPELQTNLHALERSASRMFTREVLKLVRPTLARGSTMRVTNCTKLMTQTIYNVSKYGRPNKEWHVSYLPEPFHIKCSCKRMESFGLPCDHIIGVMVHLDINEMPKCLVLDRWTMAAKESLYEVNDERSSNLDSVFMARCGALGALCRKLIMVAAKSTQRFNAERELISQRIEAYNAIDASDEGKNNKYEEIPTGEMKDPVRVVTKGCGGSSSSIGSQRRRRQACTLCGQVGHNKKTCSRNRNGGNNGVLHEDPRIIPEDEEENDDPIFGSHMESNGDATCP